MRTIVVLLALAFVATGAAILAPTASATCSVVGTGAVDCVTDFLEGEQCIDNPAPRPPQDICMGP